MRRGYKAFVLLAVAVCVVAEDSSKETSKEDESVVYVCPEEGSYCVPRTMCPMRLVSYDYGVQMKMDSTKTRPDVACGRVSPTENHVCCLRWNNLLQHEWEPSQESWFLKAKDTELHEKHEATVFPLWPGFEGPSIRQNRHIGKHHSDKEAKIEIDATPDTNLTDSQTNHTATETPKNDTKLKEEDEDEWVVIHTVPQIPFPFFDPSLPFHFPLLPRLPVQQPPLWTRFLDQPFQPPLFRDPLLTLPIDPLLMDLLPELNDFQALRPPPLWTRFLPPGDPYRPPMLRDPLMMLPADDAPIFESPDSVPRVPKSKVEGGNKVETEMSNERDEVEPTPHHFSYATSQVRVGGRLFSKTRVEDGDKAHEEVVVV